MLFPVRRPRRLRIDSRLRNMVKEFTVEPRQLIYPLFVSESIKKPDEIKSMPGQMHWPVNQIDKPVKDAMKKGITAFLLFGIPSKKDPHGDSGCSDNSVICKAIKHLKKKCPEAYIITDVCLCEYTSHGHCGFINKDGNVENDVSCQQLAKMALAHVKAGADMVAPSDMMDGRIGAIREILDDNGFENTPIMSYSVKYASSFYGPFREAADSAPGKGDRKGYQMDFANSRDALIELESDFEEGADILMVKPGLPYLDILKTASENYPCPIATYHVSGEYSMIKAAAAKGWIDEKKIVLESLTAFRRAGADLIITYFAPQAAEWIKEASK